jgi:hypothetical protein
VSNYRITVTVLKDDTRIDEGEFEGTIEDAATDARMWLGEAVTEELERSDASS